MLALEELESFYKSFLQTFVAAGDYIDNRLLYQRRQTREVKVGSIGIGGTNPIRIQSMTTCDTCDTESVVKEAIALFDAGAELVRMTAQGPREAKNLELIRKTLNEKGYTNPLVADIHFSPRAALIAADHVEKVRINPGNFADTKRFETIEYTDQQYLIELDRIHQAFKPLVLKVKELGRALRIGVNHGSLSDRIMNRYGDTPEGMVESAIEFIKIAELYDYRDIIVSMKSSNPYIMIQAYRMLVERFRKENMDYPLHLGVTEAGDGRDGRIKSAIGIGSLLLEGIGDTIRVSLTEDAVFEIPAAKEIIQASKPIQSQDWLSQFENHKFQPQKTVYEIQRFETKSTGQKPLAIGSKFPVRAGAAMPFDLSENELNIFNENPTDYLFFQEADESKARQKFQSSFYTATDANISTLAVLCLAENSKYTKIPETLPNDCAVFIRYESINFQQSGFIDQLSKHNHPVFIHIDSTQNAETIDSIINRLSVISNLVVSLNTGDNLVYPYRHLIENRAIPIHLYFEPNQDSEALFRSSIEAGSLLLSGIGDMLTIISSAIKPNLAYQTVLDILQATRIRITKTEFISCPSCGRTLFDLQSTTARIKEVTGHLKGVKIAIMGCIVNGPGEMADADFGYVGSGPGKITLYRGKEIIRKNVDSEVAPQELISLIQESGMWHDP
ncbi:MAG: (E)-4-hydroxy-3-methylbut-2-enyl-diphosphate synthase [Leptonema sp. (in: Bacteria)]|nr:(E)-4-hydroxy-3-methylbut-2-enyl-diphosphate synthase [Leptonema sp. (in: bacteria)]